MNYITVYLLLLFSLLFHVGSRAIQRHMKCNFLWFFYYKVCISVNCVSCPHIKPDKEWYWPVENLQLLSIHLAVVRGFWQKFTIFINSELRRFSYSSSFLFNFLHISYARIHTLNGRFDLLVFCYYWRPGRVFIWLEIRPKNKSSLTQWKVFF